MPISYPFLYRRITFLSTAGNHNPLKDYFGYDQEKKLGRVASILGDKTRERSIDSLMGGNEPNVDKIKN